MGRELFLYGLRITQMLLTSKEFLFRSRVSEKNFTRKRKMDFEALIKFMLSIVKKTLSLELFRFNEIIESEGFAMSKQAYSKARKKIKPEALKELYRAATVEPYMQSTDMERYKQIVERRIIAKLRKRQFTSYEEICLAVAEELEVVNNTRFQKMPGSRRDLFEEVERKMLKPLPAQRYEHAEWKTAKVSNDYHIQHGKKGNIFYYSVPYSYAYKQVDVRITTRMIEIFYEGDRIALHQRRYSGHQRYSTQPEHMPNNHKVIMEWSPARFKNWAGKIGPQTKQYITNLLEGREFPEQAYKTCMGILRLADSATVEQMEDACSAAMNSNVYTYKSFKILLSNRDEGKAIIHENVRGNEYYGGGPDVG